MKNEFLTFPFQVKEAKSDENTGFIKGFASTYGNVDLGDDIVEPGAFAKTIQDKNGSFPMLLDHNPRKPAGYQKAKEEQGGLSIESELKLFDPEVKQRYELAKLSIEYGVPMGMSIGYRPIKEEYEQRNNRTIRRLKEVKLYEVSLVLFPMNEQAFISAAKTWEETNTKDLPKSIDLFFEGMLKMGYTEVEVTEALRAREAAKSKKNPELDLQFLSDQLTKIEQVLRA